MRSQNGSVMLSGNCKVEEVFMGEKQPFDVDLIKSYPKSHRKITLGIRPYNLKSEEAGADDKGQTTYISPYGLEFQVPKNYPDGTLLKINVSIPDYWGLKQGFVNYNRIDTPGTIQNPGQSDPQQGYG